MLFPSLTAGIVSAGIGALLIVWLAL